MRRLFELAVPVTIAAATIGTLAACGDAEYRNVITVTEDVERFSAEPGDQVNIIMTAGGDILGRCDDMGGTLDVDICIDVDF
jgi:hypothetical protein